MKELNPFAKTGKMLWYAFSFCSLLLISANALDAQTPALAFDTVTIGNTGQVSFKVFPSTEVRPITAAGQDLYSYETEDHKFAIIVNPNTITSVPRFNAFTFDADVRGQGHNDAVWYVYNVRADPVGKFGDLLVDVGFKIGNESSGASIGKVKIPMHNGIFDADLLRARTEPPVVKIKLSDTQGPAVAFENDLDNLAIHLTNVEVRSTCNKCWEIGKPQALDLTIAPQASQSITLPIKPKAISAMLATALVLKPEKAQDTLTAVVSYNVDQGGPPKEKPFQIPVRFDPMLWQVALATLAGAIVGALLNLVLASGTEKLKPTSLAIRVFLVTPVAVFLLAVAASYDTKVELLGLDVDPRQVVPAGLWALFLTGGPPVIRSAKEWLSKKGPTGAQGNPAAGTSGGTQ